MSSAERYTQIHDSIWGVWNKYSGRVRETVKSRWFVLRGKVSSAVKQASMTFDSVWTACLNQRMIIQDKMDRLGRHSPAGHAAVAAINIAAMLFMITFAVEFVFHFRPYYWMMLRFCTYLIYVAVIIIIRGTGMMLVNMGPILKYVVIAISKIFMGSTRIAYGFCCLIPTALSALNSVVTVSFYLITSFWSWCFLFAAVPTLMLLWRLRIADPSDSSEDFAKVQKPMRDPPENCRPFKPSIELPDFAKVQKPMRDPPESCRPFKPSLKLPGSGKVPLPMRDPPENCRTFKPAIDLRDFAKVQKPIRDPLENCHPFKPSIELPGLAKEKQKTRCDYQEKCRTFKSSLKLPEVFFDPKFDRCYCRKCHAARGDKLYYTRGKPPKDYAIPIGWCRFGLKVNYQASSLDVFNKWHVAFHGTRVDSVNAILKCGRLLIPGDVALGGKKLSEEKGHFNDDRKPEGFDTKQIFVSPSVRYSGRDCYARPKSFTDPSTKKTYTFRAVLQLRIKPDSYKVGPETIDATSKIDPKFSNQEIEWSTKQRESIFLYGLLVKLG